MKYCDVFFIATLEDILSKIIITIIIFKNQTYLIEFRHLNLFIKILRFRNNVIKVWGFSDHK